jgi:hypothetical protein
MRQAYTLRTLILQGSAGNDEIPEPPKDLSVRRLAGLAGYRGSR